MRASRELLPQGQGKLISVFGCGGNRDSLKRPIMGEISSRLADVSIITSDNPRMEKPEDIIEEIMRGVHKESKVFVEADRARAIKLASQIAGSDDLIVISGKGAENYMDIMGKKIEYSDSGVIDILQGGI